MKRRVEVGQRHAKAIQRPSKITTAARALSDLAHELGPDAKLPTVTELREQLGVSVVTLNSALAEAEARHLIERRHGVGIYVSRLIRKGVALACAPRFFRQAAHSPFWDLLLAHSEKRAAQKSEQFSFHFEAGEPASDSGSAEGAPSTWSESSLGRAVAARQVQGVISVGVGAKMVEWLESQGVPVVAYAGHARCHVSFDDKGGIERGTRSLLESGAQRIELWTPPPDEAGAAPTIDLDSHLQAFRRAAKPYSASEGILRHASREDGDTDQEQGFALAHKVFDPASPEARPDAIVLSNDLLAHGALTALQKLGVRPGRDVQIATHANAGSPILLGHEDILLIENDPEELAAAMFNLLEGLMSGDLSPSQGVAISLAPRLRPVGEHAPHPSF